MEPEHSPEATIIGCGMSVTPEGGVGIVVMLGDMTNDGERTLGTIALNLEMGYQVRDKLNSLLTEAQIAADATESMGDEAAREYLINWAKRHGASQN
jgi:hypothetical protein